MTVCATIADMSVPDRTRRRIEDARASIVATTWRLLADRPWNELTVQDICTAADVAPRTFHRYFRDKAELLFSDSERHEDALRASLARHSCDPAHPTTFLRAVLTDLVEELEPYTADGMRQRREQLSASDELVSRDLLKRRRLAQIATDALSEQLHDPLHSQALVGAAMAVMFAAIDTWTDRGGALQPQLDDAFTAVFGTSPTTQPDED